ncbi:MAG: heme-binding protein [Parvibaculaceae bacterium]
MDLKTARKIVQACLKAAEDQGLSISAVVTDLSGNPVSLERMDDVSHINTEVAIKKARTAAGFKMPTHDLVEAVSRDQHLRMVVMTDQSLNVLPGGVPIEDDTGTIVGALGVAGGFYLQDRAIAEFAIKS